MRFRSSGGGDAARIPTDRTAAAAFRKVVRRTHINCPLRTLASERVQGLPRVLNLNRQQPKKAATTTTTTTNAKPDGTDKARGCVPVVTITRYGLIRSTVLRRRRVYSVVTYKTRTRTRYVISVSRHRLRKTRSESPPFVFSKHVIVFIDSMQKLFANVRTGNCLKPKIEWLHTRRPIGRKTRGYRIQRVPT